MRTLLLLLFALPLTAQTLMMTPADLAFLRSEAAANSPRWQALKADCDALYPRVVQVLTPGMLDGNYSDINTGGPWAYGTTTIKGGYEGGDMAYAIFPLGLCYATTIGNTGFPDQTRAAAYGAKAKDILMTLAKPTAWMTRPIPVANVVVSNGTATVNTPHSVTAGYYFVVTIGGTGNTTLDQRQQAYAPTLTSFTFPTTAPDGTYTPTSIDFTISTDAENGVRRSIGQVVPGTTTRLNMISGSVFYVGQQVRVWGFSAPYNVLNGTWTAAAATAGTTLRLPVNTTGLSTTTTLPMGAFAAPLEDAFRITSITTGATTTITCTGSNFAAGQTVRVWGLSAPYDVLNGSWTAASGTGTTTLKVAYDSSALSNYTAPAGSTEYAGGLQRLKLHAQTITGLAVGQTVTVTGVRGCTGANGQWKISTITKPLTVTAVDGSPALAMDGSCFFDAPRQSSDAGYHLRHLLPALAIGYDWVGALLSPTEKQAVVDKMVETFWISNDSTLYPNLVHPMSNYYTATISGFALADVSMNTQLPQRVRDWIQGRVNFMASFYGIWIAQGGYPQGLRDYGNQELGRIYRSAVAAYKAGSDWRAAPANFTWLDGTLNYMMGTIAPDYVQTEDYGVVGTVGGYKTPQDTRISADSTVAIAAWANAVGHASAAKFSKFHRETLANVKAAATVYLPAYNNAYEAGVRSLPVWDFLLERDWTEADWTPSALTYYAFTGDYAISRTAWNDPNAVYLTLQSNVHVDQAGQGKEKMKLGEVTIRRGGNKRLVGTAEGFVARVGTKGNVDDLHWQNGYSNQTVMRFNRFYNGLWASATAYGGSQYYSNWCSAGTNLDATDRNLIPNYNPAVTSMSANAQPRLTHKVDQSSFSYWRAEKLECYYTYSATQVAPTTDHKNHVQSWKREVVFLRPSGVAVVRDVSKVRFSTDDRFINWVVPKGGTITDVVGGKQFTVSSTLLGGDIGAITFLEPAGLQVSQVDCIKSDQKTSYNACDRLEVRPAANDHTNDIFFTMLDPSGDLTALHSAAMLPSTNGTALEIGTDALVAFAGETLPMTYTLATASQRNHIVIGLTPGESYKAITNGSTITIASISTLGESGQTMVADSAGTIVFQFGLDPTQPYISTTTLPDAVQNTVYSAPLAAVNGTPPYQWSVLSGTLPTGLSLTTAGTLTGTPEQTGLFSFRVRAQDAAAKTAEADLALNVQAPVPAIQITTTSLPAGQENQSYEQLLAVSGGTLPLQWSVPGGAECLSGLGLSLDQTGRISGKPQASGTCALTVQVQDGNHISASRQYQLLVQGAAPLMTAFTVAGSSSAAVTFGYRGLQRAQGCEVNALNGAVIQASATSDSGSGRRTVLLTGLQPDTQYRLSAYCGSAGLAQSVLFQTRPEQTGTSSITIGLAAPERVGAWNAVIQYGLQGLTSSISASCPDKCKVVLSGLSRGALYQYRWQWTGGSQTPSSSTRYFVVP